MTRILVCEDNDLTAKLFIAALRRRPYELKVVTTADQIIETTVAYAPGLILMDLRLPGVSGREAIRSLRADPRTAQVPILLHSANAAVDEIAAELGVGYVAKPFSLEDFRERVAEVTGTSSLA